MTGQGNPGSPEALVDPDAIPCEESVGAVFERQVREHPDRTAVVSAKESISYGELNRQANRVAWALRKRAAEGGQRVGLCLRSGVMQATALLGILKAGLTAVVVDPLGPEEGARTILEDAGARWLITDETTFAGASQRLPPDCEASIAGELGGAFPDRDPDWTVSPAVPACLIFTSGTTGKPKGVIRPHRSIVWVARIWAKEVLGLRHHRSCFLAGYHTGNGISDLFRTLLIGGTLIDFDLRGLGIDRLASWLVEQRATIFSAPASVFRQFIHGLPPEQRFPDVELVRLGNEKVLRRDVEAFRRHFEEDCVFLNVISSTETGNIAIHRLDHESVVGTDTVPIGRPVPGVDLRLIGENGEEVGFDQPGEITVCSPGVADGYWKQPELTARVFRIAEESTGTRRYHTGDLAIRRSDGCLEYIGRRDHRVKIRGLGVDLQGIETVLGNHPDVRAAVVVGRDLDTPDPWLAAFVVPEPGTLPHPTELRRHLRRSLPEAAVPSTFSFLDDIPLNSRGKVDRTALTQVNLVRKRMGSGELGSGPETDPTTTEAMMADLWCRLLGMQRIGLDEDFFDLGGHSLLSLRLLEQIQQVFRTRLAPHEFFENPTVRSLAACVWRSVEQPGWASGHASSQRLVSLQTHGEGPPIFFFPGGYGDETELIWPAWFSRRHLGAAQPLYALQCPGVDGRGSFRRTLAGEARECLREMRQIQPRGPWFLIGSCVGGNLAYEVARQAQAAGEAVPMLMLGDCSRPGTADYLRKYASQPGWGLRQYAMNTLYLAFPFAHPVLTSAGRRRLWRQWFSRSEAGNTTGPVEFGEEWKWRVFQHAESALRRQMSRPRGRFEGRIDLAVSQERAGSQRILSWRVQATQGTEVLVLPGTHSTYLIDGAPLIEELCQRRIREYHPAR